MQSSDHAGSGLHCMRGWCTEAQPTAQPTAQPGAAQCHPSPALACAALRCASFLPAAVSSRSFCRCLRPACRCFSRPLSLNRTAPHTWAGGRGSRGGTVNAVNCSLLISASLSSRQASSLRRHACSHASRQAHATPYALTPQWHTSQVSSRGWGRRAADWMTDLCQDRHLKR